MTVSEIVDLMEGKRRYIADRMPMNDFNNGQMSALAQMIDFIKEHDEVDDGYAE